MLLRQRKYGDVMTAGRCSAVEKTKHDDMMTVGRGLRCCDRQHCDVTTLCHQDVTNMVNTVAAVLHLGDVSFTDRGDGRTVAVTQPDVLHKGGCCLVWHSVTVGTSVESTAEKWKKRWQVCRAHTCMTVRARACV